MLLILPDDGLNFFHQLMAPIGRKQKLPDLLRVMDGAGMVPLLPHSNGQSHPESSLDSYFSRPCGSEDTVLPLNQLGTLCQSILDPSVSLLGVSPLFLQLAGSCQKL